MFGIGFMGSRVLVRRRARGLEFLGIGGHLDEGSGRRSGGGRRFVGDSKVGGNFFLESLAF
jgi:hypothetical protein